MPKFMAIHTLPPGAMSEPQVREIAQAAQQDPAVRGYRSFLNLSEGKICCILDAPDKQTLANWYEKMGIPFDSIHQVELEDDGGTVRKL
jgi:hypothetical protein